MTAGAHSDRIGDHFVEDLARSPQDLCGDQVPDSNLVRPLRKTPRMVFSGGSAGHASALVRRRTTPFRWTNTNVWR